MLIFIDESGDPGNPKLRGASKFFILSMVIFENEEDAYKCSNGIEKLKKKIGWTGEFHFKRNSNKIRKIVLEELSRHKFKYCSVVLHKKTTKTNIDYYTYAMEVLFSTIKDKVKNATVTFDETESIKLKHLISNVLRKKININDKSIIKKIKVERSSSNNLIQVTDYISGLLSKNFAHYDDNSIAILKKQKMWIRVIEV